MFGTGERFEDYTEAVRKLALDARFPPDLVEALARLPGFRNVLIHEYVALDLQFAIAAINALQPVERFLEIVAEV